MQEKFKISILVISLKIINLRLQPDILGASELQLPQQVFQLHPHFHLYDQI